MQLDDTIPQAYPILSVVRSTPIVVMTMPDFDDEEPTIKIPRETMHESRERSRPAHTTWGESAAHGEGFTPAGPDRPTREIITPISDGVPHPVDEEATDRTLPRKAVS